MYQMGLASRTGVLFVALLTALGLQAMRAFFPLVVYVYGQRPGVTSMGMGLLAIGVFLTAWLAALPARWLGPARAAALLAGLVVAARLAAHLSDPDAALWLTAVGTVAFLWALPAVLAVARSRGAGEMRGVAVGLLAGLVLDTAVAGAFWTWDVLWQRTLWPVLVTLVLAAACGLLARDAARLKVDSDRTDTSLGAALALAGLGPVLLLNLLLFQNTARVTAVSGWPLPASLFLVLTVGAFAVAAASGVRSGRIGLLAAAGLIPAAALAHGSGASALLGLAVGGLCAGVLTAAMLVAQSTGARRGGLARTAVGWGLAMLLFVVPAFLYYVGYDLRLPFDNTVLPPVLAVVAALAALVPALRLERAVGPQPAFGRAVVLLLVVPLALWVWPQPQPAQSGVGWPVRVMSYNLHQGYGVSGAQDLEALARTIEASGAEIVALQEVSRGWVINGSTEMLTWMARRLGMRTVWGPAADPIWGNAILSRRPVGVWGNVELPRGGAAMRRAALWVEVDLGARASLLVIATHFHHVEGHGHIRERQAAEVLRLWNRRKRTVLLGDLNATPDAREIAMLREAGLRDAFALAGGGEGFTYRSDRPYERIDYIWVSPDLAARDFRVLPGQASDHLGIAVTVTR